MSLPEVSKFDAHWTVETIKLRATMACLLCTKVRGCFAASSQVLD